MLHHVLFDGQTKMCSATVMGHVSAGAQGPRLRQQPTRTLHLAEL